MAKLARLPRLERTVRREPAHGRTPRLRTRYYAFLSYSHKDKELADWLHRELEKFRVPSSLAGKLTANGVVPRRLTPIFRDQHDLSAGDDLAVEIEAALAASQFLVVLCSPTAAKSRWTNLEIESFKRTRPEGCVLAAVAEVRRQRLGALRRAVSAAVVLVAQRGREAFVVRAAWDVAREWLSRDHRREDAAFGPRALERFDLKVRPPRLGRSRRAQHDEELRSRERGLDLLREVVACRQIVLVAEDRR